MPPALKGCLKALEVLNDCNTMFQIVIGGKNTISVKKKKKENYFLATVFADHQLNFSLLVTTNENYDIQHIYFLFKFYFVFLDHFSSWWHSNVKLSKAFVLLQ